MDMGFNGSTYASWALSSATLARDTVKAAHAVWLLSRRIPRPLMLSRLHHRREAHRRRQLCAQGIAVRDLGYLAQFLVPLHPNNCSIQFELKLPLSSVFPSKWKIACISPIFKNKGDQSM